MYRPVPDEDESRRFQMDITSLCNWSHKWQLPFNATKCKIMHMGNMNQQYTYNMDGHALEFIREEKDLGVTVDADLKFHSHTTRVVNKANRILGMIKKSLASLDAISLPVLYKAFIRPHLEHGNVIWGPHFRDDQIKVERVQRRATKLIDHLRDLPYEDRLKELKLPSLYYRRRRGDMIQVFKIMKGFNRVPKEQFFKGNMHTISPGRNRVNFQILAYLLTIDLLYGTGCLSYWFCYYILRLDSSETTKCFLVVKEEKKGQQSWNHTQTPPFWLPQQVRETLERVMITWHRDHYINSAYIPFKQQPLTTRGHHLKLFKPRAQKLVRRQFFSTRIINDWNQLPSDIVEADTVNTFKARLDRHWVDFQNQQAEQLTPC